MRKILSLIICLLLCFNTAAALAADNDLTAKGLAGAQKTYAKFIDEALAKSGIDRSTVDEKRISITTQLSFDSIKSSPNPYDAYSVSSTLSVIAPLSDGSDTICFYFDKGKYKSHYMRSQFLDNPLLLEVGCPTQIYSDETETALKQNSLTDVEELLNVTMLEVVHMSAYYVKNDGTWYIIPYNVYDSTPFDSIEVEGVLGCFEIGNAYTRDEYINRCELAKDIYRKNLNDSEEKKESERTDPVASKDENDDTVIKNPGSDKWELLDELEKTDNKTNTDKTDVKTEDKKTDEKTDTKTDDKKEATPAVKLSNTQKADALKAQGLFKGTENGYELDRTLTRSEGVTMMIRLLGKEDKALTSSYTPVFDDVAKDDWYYGYVMCAYNNSIVMGTSSTEFTPDRDISAKEFTTLVLRALGHETAAPENAFLMAQNAGLLTSDEAAALESKPDFTRGDMVSIAYTANEIANQTK